MDVIDDIAMAWLVFADGMDVWSGAPLQGKGSVKAGLKEWLGQYRCTATATMALATPDSNKVRCLAQAPLLGLVCVALVAWPLLL